MTGRSSPSPPAKRDQLARDRIGGKIVGSRKLDQPLERLDRIAPRAKVERNEIGLAARQHRDRRRAVAEMAAVVELGQRRLDGAVAAVDRQHLRPDPGDRLHRLADLARVLDLIVEDVGVIGAIFADARQLGDIAASTWDWTARRSGRAACRRTPASSHEPASAWGGIASACSAIST